MPQYAYQPHRQHTRVYLFHGYIPGRGNQIDCRHDSLISVWIVIQPVNFNPLFFYFLQFTLRPYKTLEDTPLHCLDIFINSFCSSYAFTPSDHVMVHSFLLTICRLSSDKPSFSLKFSPGFSCFLSFSIAFIIVFCSFLWFLYEKGASHSSQS